VRGRRRGGRRINHWEISFHISILHFLLDALEIKFEIFENLPHNPRGLDIVASRVSGVEGVWLCPHLSSSIRFCVTSVINCCRDSVVSKAV
jgi:hypothetical protein